MFSIHDRVRWTEVVEPFVFDTPTGTIVAEEPYDYYKVRRDDTGKCEILCYRRLRLIDES